MRNRQLRVITGQVFSRGLSVSLESYDPRIVTLNHTPFYFTGYDAENFDVYNIDWGDGESGTDLIHIYDTPGDYDIVLTTSSTISGLSGTTTVRITVVNATYTPMNARALDVVRKASYTNDAIREAIDVYFTALGSVADKYVEMKTMMTDRLTLAGALLHSKWNFFDPTDADSSYRTTYEVGHAPFVDYSGVKYDGLTQYGRTHLTASTEARIGQTNVCLMVYTANASSNGGNDYGAQSSNDNLSYFTSAIGFLNGANHSLFDPGQYHISASNGSRSGFYIFNRTDDSLITSTETFKNGVSVGAGHYSTSRAKVNRESYEGCTNFGFPAAYSDQRYVYRAIAVDITAADVIIISAAVNTLQGSIEAALGLAAGTRKVY